jgi:hypothetical protein
LAVGHRPRLTVRAIACSSWARAAGARRRCSRHSDPTKCSWTGR